MIEPHQNFLRRMYEARFRIVKHKRRIQSVFSILDPLLYFIHELRGLILADYSTFMDSNDWTTTFALEWVV